MRVVHRTTSLIILSLLVAAAAGAEWQPGPDDEILVSPEDPATQMKWCDLIENDGLSVNCVSQGISGEVVSSTSHGTLSDAGTGYLEYSPVSSFWRLGTDSFTYRVDTVFEMPLFVNVTLKAGHYGQVRRIEESFEGESVEGLSGEAYVTQQAAIAGSKGLFVRVGGGVTDSVFTFYNNGSDAADLCDEEQEAQEAQEEQERVPVINCFDNGDGAQGGNDTMKVRPPPIEDPTPFGGGGAGASGHVEPEIGPVVIYSLEGWETDDIVAEIELVPYDYGWEVVAHLYHGELTYSTQPFPLASAEPELRLDWWDGQLPIAGGWRDGGLMLWVDGEVVDAILGVQGWYVGIARRRVGAMIDSLSRASLSVDIDDLSLQASDASVPGAISILYDGFEDDLSDWDTSFAYSIGVDYAAALVGLKGLRVEPTMGFNSSLLDTTPTDADQVGVRFKIAPGTLAMTSGARLQMLALSTGNQTMAGLEQVRLVLQEQGNHFEIAARVHDEDHWLALPGVQLPNETTTIELRWRASDDGIKNGRLGLWFDGRLAQDAQGLDNAGIQIESVRLGAWGLGGLLSGAFYVDNFEAWSAVEAQ
ncbi:MAG: hypothetical protein GY719_30560 [bacterium]|nr:hypothetical protein [bacterium]